MTRKHHTARTTTSDSRRQHRNKTSGRNLTWLWIALGVLALVSVGILLLRSKTAPSVEISPAQAYVKYQQGAFILDVRSQAEWDQFHIKGSTLIPLDQLPSRLSEVPMDKDVVAVCLTGHRSQTGTAILQQAGYKNVFCLSGGLTAWKAAGYPLEGAAP
jgi:rhodanese-related sulfurtransferase